MFITPNKKSIFFNYYNNNGTNTNEEIVFPS